jgi:hypothetical protein
MTFGLSIQVTFLKPKEMKISALTLAAVMVLLMGAVNLEAQPGHAKNKKARHYPSHKAAGLHDNRGKKSYYFYDRNDRNIRHHGHDYRYSGGRFYVKHHHGYRMVPPPHGIRVSYIPEGYVTLKVAGVPYFYFDGVYYRHNAAGRYYEVVPAPIGAVVPYLPRERIRRVKYEGRNAFEYNNVIYSPVPAESGVRYRVAVNLGPVFVAIGN